MATLLSICQDALRDVGSFEVPSTIANNSNETAELILSLINRLGRRLALIHDWQALQVEYTFTTTSGTASYVLPSGFRKFALLTQWDRTNLKRCNGPTDPKTWQYIKSSGLLTQTIDRYFRIFGNEFLIYPTPDATGDTIAYEYYSSLWCQSSGGTGQTAFAADTDVPLLDEELLILGLKAAFLKEKGEAYDEALTAYDETYRLLTGHDNGTSVIRFNNRSRRDDMNLPEMNYGN